MIVACGILPLAMGEDGGGGTPENGAESASDRGEEVHGLAYTAQEAPANIDEPDEETLPDSDERPGNEAIRYDGTWAYDLIQGTKADDKRRWAATDYIHWTAQGATLVAEGQIQDTDPRETGRVSSQAWGAQIVAAQVTQAEGTQGTISAENMIGFSHRYSIMGSRIQEASVMLQGSAVDIKGTSHSYSISDSKAQVLSEVTTQSRAVAVSNRTGAGVSLAAGPTGGAAGITVAGETEIAELGRIDYGESRRFAGAGNGAKSINLPPIKHSVSGATPLEHTYKVYSKGNVTLTAKGAGADVVGGTTVVMLEEFKIRNQLRVFKKAESTHDGGSGDGGGGDGGVSPGSGSGGSGGGGSGGDGSGGDGTGRDGTGGDPEAGTSGDSEGEASEIDESGGESSDESAGPIGPTRSPSGSIRTESRELLAEDENSVRLIDTDTELIGAKMGYLFDPQTGAVLDGATRFADGFYEGKNIRRIDKKTMLIERGTFTSCNLAEPHYHFNARKMKLKVGENVVARQVSMHISDIPVMVLPFYYKDLKSGRRSGILFPNVNIGVSSRDGRYIRDLGYYWATNEYTDFKFEMDYNERREATFKVENIYAKRYAFDGRLNFQYLRAFSADTTGDEWKFTSEHRQPELWEVWRASAKIDVSSKNVTRTNLSSNHIRDLIDSRLYSTASLSRSFDNGSSLNLSFARTQFPNADDGDPINNARMSEFNIPIALSFKSSPIMGGLKRPGQNPVANFLRDFTFAQGYSGRYDQERAEAFESDAMSAQARLGLTWAPDKVGPIRLSSSANFNDRWSYTQSERIGYQQVLVPVDPLDPANTDSVLVTVPPNGISRCV